MVTFDSLLGREHGTPQNFEKACNRRAYLKNPAGIFHNLIRVSENASNSLLYQDSVNG